MMCLFPKHVSPDPAWTDSGLSYLNLNSTVETQRTREGSCELRDTVIGSQSASIELRGPM